MKVAIIGGGPAGLFTAILLARKGIRVEVFDKSIWPIEKVCGEGIMPLGVSLLEKYNLLKFIDKNQMRDFNGIRYINNDGQKAFGEFKKEPGKVIRRLALSEGLFKAASLEKKITLHSNNELVKIEEHSEFISINVKINGKKFSFEKFDYLIGADGLKSKVRSLSQLDGKKIKLQPNRMGARVHVEMKPWDNKVQVRWQDGIECYVAPSSNNCVEFNFGWDHDVLQPQNSIKGGGLEKGLFSFFPELDAKAKGFLWHLLKVKFWQILFCDGIKLVEGMNLLKQLMKFKNIISK